MKLFITTKNIELSVELDYAFIYHYCNIDFYFLFFYLFSHVNCLSHFNYYTRVIHLQNISSPGLVNYSQRC